MHGMRAIRRGFTLLEVMVVVAIIGAMAAIAVPGFYGAFKRQAVRDQSRQLVSALRDARSLAMSRSTIPGLVCPGPPPCVPRSVGVRVTSRTQYELFGDADTADGGEVVFQTVDISRRSAESQVEIDEADIPFIVRFGAGGVLAGRVANGRDIHVVDTVTNETHIIQVTAAGFSTLDVN